MYAGEWRADAIEGRGTQRFADHSVLHAVWSHGYAEGVAQAQTTDGDRYVGGRLKGKIEGTALYLAHDGFAYWGSWRDGVPEGTGTSFTPTRILLASGTWSAGASTSGSSRGLSRSLPRAAKPSSHRP
ncbi:MAG: hypothetical protein JOY70_11290 [Acidisphaera sp.]|nr:hypothetical protein [Acidisphaera sp.]